MRPRFGFAAAAERVRDDTGPLAAPFADARPRPSLRASSSVIRVTDFSLDLDDESRVEIPVLERVVGVLRRVAARVADYASSALHIVAGAVRSEEHTSELQSLMRISYAGFGLKKKKTHT